MDFISSIPNSAFSNKAGMSWGILGTARIAAKSVIPAIKASKHNHVYAVASRDLTRAAEFVRDNEIPKAYGSYEELLRDENIQAVYIPLPNSEHSRWAIRAMEAGKHVLVEKPFALNADEAQLMVSTALEKSVVLMEAFMYRYHARTAQVRELVRKGALGKLRFIQSSMSFPLNNPDDIRLSAGLGGGSLYDLGCYCVDLQRMLVGREPRRVKALSYQGNSGVDLQVSATMDFGEQVYGHFDVSFNAFRQQHTRIVGSEGALDLDSPFGAKAEASQAYLMKDGETKKLNIKRENAYEKMIEHFYYVIMSREAPLFPLADSVKNLVVIDALFQSLIDGGRLVSLTPTTTL
ncbi:MAG: Gfo/Idh/MocA family oxidoreductase [Anaerolineaceae bacterium]